MRTNERLSAPVLMAAALAAISLGFLVYLWDNPVGAPLFGVSSGSLPTAMAAVLFLTSSLLLVQSWMASSAPEPDADQDGWRGKVRLLVLLAICIAFISALPWFGFLISGGFLAGGTALLFGNRRTAAIIGVAVVAPLVLSLFFEKAMVIYLPAGRFFQ